HPLMHTLEAIRATGRVQDIKLGPLTAEDLGGLVADSLRIDEEEAARLAELVHTKTDGNPFFVIQFLHVLADGGLLSFDHEQTRWSFDLGSIHAKQHTDNVVELLAGKLTRLPLATQDALRQLACLGNLADVSILSIVLETPEDQVHAVLWGAMGEHLLDRREGVVKVGRDRVREAAYALIAEQPPPEARVTIGQLGVADTLPVQRDGPIFEIDKQLDRGGPLLGSQRQREQLAPLN